MSGNPIDTLRDAVLGNPPDPATKPSREGVIAAATEMRAEYLSVLAVAELIRAVDVIYATRAELEADLAYDAPAIGWVYADSTDANNDLYTKSGASGAGSWTLTTALHGIVSGEAAARAAADVDLQDQIDDLGTDIDSLSTDVANNHSGLNDITETTSIVVEGYGATSEYAGTSFGGWAGVILLSEVSVGTPVSSLTIERVLVGASATKINLKIYSRLDSSVDAPPTDCTLLFSQDYTLAELGLTAGATTRKNITFAFPAAFIKASGSHLAYRWEAQDGSSARQTSSTGNLTDASVDAVERGWYYPLVASTTYGQITSPTRLAHSVSRNGRVISASGGESVLASASSNASVSGNNVTVSGAVSRNGTDYAFSGTVSLSAAASGKERIDKIVIDRNSFAVSAVAGASRDEGLDALEWQGSTTANSIVVARAQVTDSIVVAQSCADFKGLIKTGTEGEIAAHIERNRRILRPVMGKVSRGSVVNLGGYGDSITAIQSGTPSFTANGTVRDRGHTYLSNYPSDSLALVPLYDFGDGAGAVHTKLGWNWAIKAALDALAGSEVVAYLNYGIGGTTSQSSTNNGLDTSRIAEPLGDSLDLVVIGFGMNERGQSYTYANIVNMIGQFQAVGTACAVMGVPRPNANQNVAAWRYTNDALEAAAMDAGAAYISTAAIADDRNLGGMGLPAEVLASANSISGGYNHPGIYELDIYGQAAVVQLGL